MVNAFIYAGVFYFFGSFISSNKPNSKIIFRRIKGSSTNFRQYVSFSCNVHSYPPILCIWYRFSVLIKSFTWKNDFLTSILHFFVDSLSSHALNWSACLKLRHHRSNQTSKWYYYAFMSFDLKGILTTLNSQLEYA